MWPRHFCQDQDQDKEVQDQDQDSELQDQDQYIEVQDQDQDIKNTCLETAHHWS